MTISLSQSDFRDAGMPCTVRDSIRTDGPDWEKSKYKTRSLTNGYQMSYIKRRADTIKLQVGTPGDYSTLTMKVNEICGFVHRGDELAGFYSFYEYDVDEVVYNWEFVEIMDTFSDSAGRFAQMMDSYRTKFDDHITTFGTVIELGMIWLRKATSHPTLLEEVVDGAVRIFRRKNAAIFLAAYPLDVELKKDESFASVQDRLTQRYERAGFTRMTKQPPHYQEIYMWRLPEGYLA